MKIPRENTWYLTAITEEEEKEDKTNRTTEDSEWIIYDNNVKYAKNENEEMREGNKILKRHDQ